MEPLETASIDAKTELEAPETKPLFLCEKLGKVSGEILQIASETEDSQLQDHLIETSARLSTYCVTERELAKRKIANEIHSLEMIIESIKVEQDQG